MRKLVFVIACMALAACGPRDTRPDSEKLAGFRTSVAAIDHRITAASNAYTKASNAALDAKDRAAFTAAAAALRAALDTIRPDAAKLEAPEFANAAARDHSGQVLAAMLAAIDANRDAAVAIGRMADPENPTQAELAAIQDARDQVSTASITESDALFSLRTDIGTAPGN